MYYEEKDISFISNISTGIRYPIHIHQQIELVHALEGSIRMQIGAKHYTLNPGDLAFVFPNVLHDYDMVSPRSEIKMQITNCNIELLAWHKKDLLSMLPANPIIPAASIHEDVLYAEEKLNELNYNEENAQLISSLVSLLLSRTFPMLKLIPLPTRTESDLPHDIIVYISNHYLDDLSLDGVGSVFGIGRYSLSRIFSNILGITFIDYLNSLRINHAEHLLRTTNMTVIQIAMECGYHNQQTFNRVFKERFGCTPRVCRGPKQ
jgi:AraC-like DNA-binding protein